MAANRTAIDKKAASEAIDAFLRAIGRDPEGDPALFETGTRVTDSFVDDLCEGYDVDVRGLLAANVIARAGGRDPDGLLAAAAASTEFVVVRDVAVTTTCPHHLMAAWGVATIAFAPRDKLLGIGAVAKVVDAFAHRLTLQEEIGENVASALAVALDPTWTACRLVLSHSCMTARGERRHGATVETISIAGAADRGLVHRVLGGSRS
jgi:GTP cyclohydrolase IA